MMRNFSQLASVVQRNCDISDARHAGDYGLCSYLLKMREFYRWENELPFTRVLPKDQVGEWLTVRERLWDGDEGDDFLPLPLIDGDIDPFEADAANRALLSHGYVYSAGYGRLRKPMFFLGELLRVEERAGLTILVSSCEYARELAAPAVVSTGRGCIRALCEQRRIAPFVAGRAGRQGALAGDGPGTPGARPACA